MADAKEKVEVDNRPTSQIDLERRLNEGFLGEGQRTSNVDNDVLNPEKVVNPYELEDNETGAYRGVSPEYMNYANESERPYEPSEGPEAESLKLLSAGVAAVRKTAAVDNTPATEVGTTATETLNTAVSGSDYSAKLVDAEKDYQGAPQTDATEVREPVVVEAPKAATKSGPSATSRK